MNKSTLFIQAHVLTRATVARFGGSYQVTFSAALKIIYNEAKNQPRRHRRVVISNKTRVISLEEKLERLECSATWEKNGMRRIYFNDLCKLAGVEFENINGRFGKIWQDSVEIDRDCGMKLVSKLNFAKFWYDMNEKKFASKDLTVEQAAKIQATIEAKIAA